MRIKRIQDTGKDIMILKTFDKKKKVITLFVWCLNVMIYYLKICDKQEKIIMKMNKA